MPQWDTVMGDRKGIPTPPHTIRTCQRMVAKGLRWLHTFRHPHIVTSRSHILVCMLDSTS